MSIKSFVSVLTVALIAAAIIETVKANASEPKIQKYEVEGKSVGVRATVGKEKPENKPDPTEIKQNKNKKAAKPFARPIGRTPETRYEPNIFNPDTAYEEGELIVINPPNYFLTRIRSMGYRALETVDLTMFDMKIVRLRTPTGVNVHAAINQLRTRFPRIEIDLNHQFDL